MAKEEEEMAQRRGAEAATETEERELSTNSLFMKEVKMHTGGQIDMRDLICGSAMQSMEAIWATSTGNAKAHLQQKGLMKFISEEEPRTVLHLVSSKSWCICDFGGHRQYSSVNRSYRILCYND